MRVPLSWLHEYCNPGLEPLELAELLSMTGTEVERLGSYGAPSADGFVVGKVLAAEQHPNADRLKVCTVDVGDGSERTIVCGAPNVAAGQTVPVILPGATIAGGHKIGEAKLRGVMSSGMIMSEAELGVSEESKGIAVLDDSLEAGTPLSQVLPVSDTVLELEITPNRPDCLGVYGVARELHAVTGAALAPAPWLHDAPATGSGDVNDFAAVEVQTDPDLCPRFTARVFTHVHVGPSPLWMKARLAAAGQRSISNVVDVTNYVMLLTGQPLHAFDLDQVAGGKLVIRGAKAGEKLLTLDEEEREMPEGAVLVCDAERPLAVAGIMGGMGSGVSETTTRVLMEVANWNGPDILKTSGKLALRSEASRRFEKQLHPATTMQAQNLAAQLLVEMGATLVPGTIDVDAGTPEIEPLLLTAERTRSLLGMDIPADVATGHLERLGFKVIASSGAAGDLLVTAPPERSFDIRREADLIEEVARVHDLDKNLPATLPAQARRGGLDPMQRLRRRAEDLLAGMGLDEAINWSFVDPDSLTKLSIDASEATPVTIGNPLAVTHSVMRTTLLGGLLDSASRNVARGAERVALFESGHVYLNTPAPAEGGPFAGQFPGDRPAPITEPHRVGGIVVGSLAAGGWLGASDTAGFYDAKGLVEALAAGLGGETSFETSAEPFLYPGRAAAVSVNGAAAGWVGEIHPLVAEGWNLPGGVAFELDLAAFASNAGHVVAYQDVTAFPASHEDIAVVVDGAVPSARVREVVLAAGGELLRSAEVFDVYEGEQIGEGNKSLALRLEYRADDRTLTDEEVAERRAAIVAALASETGGELRE